MTNPLTDSSMLKKLNEALPDILARLKTDQLTATDKDWIVFALGYFHRGLTESSAKEPKTESL